MSWCPPIGALVILQITGEVYTVVSIRPEPAYMAFMGREWSARGPGGVTIRQYEHEPAATWRFIPALMEESEEAEYWDRAIRGMTGKDERYA